MTKDEQEKEKSQFDLLAFGSCLMREEPDGSRAHIPLSEVKLPPCNKEKGHD